MEYNVSSMTRVKITREGQNTTKALYRLFHGIVVKDIAPCWIIPDFHKKNWIVIFLVLRRMHFVGGFDVSLMHIVYFCPFECLKCLSI